MARCPLLHSFKNRSDENGLKKILFFVFVCLMILTFGTTSFARTVLVSHESGLEILGYGDKWCTHLTSALDTATGNNVAVVSDFSNLSQMLTYDALWLDPRKAITGSLTDTEINNIKSFIATGRRVVMIGDNGYDGINWTNWDNQILGIVGGTFVSGSAYYGNTIPVASNSLTDGVSYVKLMASGLANGGTPLFDQNFATLWGSNVLTILDVNALSDDVWGEGGWEGMYQFQTNIANWVANSSYSNEQPVASIKSYTLEEGAKAEGRPMVGGTIIFTPEGSTDPDGGDIARYDWEFKNKQTGETIEPKTCSTSECTVVFPEPEEYTATLTVTDDEGTQGTATVTLDLRLQKGDLILIRSGRPYSDVFDWLSQEYTHIGMYVGKDDIYGKHWMIESAIGVKKSGLQDGVQWTTFYRWSIDNGETYADAVRVNLPQEVKDAAVEWANSKRGLKYDLKSIGENR
ncbi:MAG: hypothetical protein A4E63_00454 [Syntrophorhabdus sp. PtaU1.Bin050]|nr:MAG: hypothetical protein A4E63_00454 [Syntrophorhabdus sp. PtaU1.Bin050]